MKARYVISIATGLVLAMGAAQAHDRAKRAERYDATPYTSGALPNAIHSGAMSYDDQILVDKVASALANDRQLQRPGITATVTAKDGQISLSGSADRVSQAARAEKIARDIAGAGNVSGTLSTQGG